VGKAGGKGGWERQVGKADGTVRTYATGADYEPGLVSSAWVRSIPTRQAPDRSMVVVQRSAPAPPSRGVQGLEPGLQ